MKAVSEKSMLILTALALGLIITWLIATDPKTSGAPSLLPNGTGIATTTPPHPG